MHNPVWQSVSLEGKDFILSIHSLLFNQIYLGLLNKNRRERMTLEQTLEHPWIGIKNKKITELRRKSSNERDKIL